MAWIRGSYGLCSNETFLSWPPKSKGGKKGKNPKLLDRLSDLKADWWTQVPNDRAAYNYRTDTCIVGVKCETLLDGGARVNSWAEEIVVGAINVAMAKGIQPNDPLFPVVQLENGQFQSAAPGSHEVTMFRLLAQR